MNDAPIPAMPPMNQETLTIPEQMDMQIGEMESALARLRAFRERYNENPEIGKLLGYLKEAREAGFYFG